MKKNIYKFFLFTVIFLLLFGSGCKKFADPGIDQEEYMPDTTFAKNENKRRLLLISVDGLPADALLTIAPPNMISLLSQAKYSMDVRAVPLTNSASWASMMTGNDTLIHRIWDSTFYARPVDSTSSIPVSPNLTALRLLYNANPDIKTAVVSSWPNLVNTLFKDAAMKVVTTDDSKTKEEAKRILGNEVDVLILQFGSVINSGINYGFSATSVEFRSAVIQIDEYIKEIIDVVKARPNYVKEEWLIMVTTTQGGSGLNTERFNVKPGFLIAYNPLFKIQNLVEMNPSIRVVKEDLTPQILYWMHAPMSNAVQTGQLWIDRFGVEYIR